MARAFDGTIVTDQLKALPCGGVPMFDHQSGYAYRCDSCNAVIGSIGMPRDCYEQYSKNSNDVAPT